MNINEMTDARKQSSFKGIKDKVSFVAFLPTLARATEDNNEATAGYLLREVEFIAQKPDPFGHLLIDYLNKRLGSSSPAVKLKVLKIMDHLAQKGTKNIRQILRQNDGHLKMATKFHCLPDPLTGTATSEAIRVQAQELLALLFDPNSLALDETGMSVSAKHDPVLGGLGSYGKSRGKYQGFGNNPVSRDGSFAEKVLGTLERWTNTNDHSEQIIKAALSSNPGKYIPVELNLELVENCSFLFEQPSSQAKPSRVHIPGQAGGGWEDCIENEPYSHGLEETQKAHRSEEQCHSEETSLETSIITEFCSSTNLPCTLTEIKSTGKRCGQLNVVQVMHVLSTCFSSDNEDTFIIRAMLLLEWFLRSDFMPSTILAELCTKPLKGLISHHCSQIHDKAEKILLVLQHLERCR